MIDSLLHFLSLLDILPIWWAIKHFEEFICKLFQKVCESEGVEYIGVKIFFSELELEEEPAKDDHKNEYTYDGLKNTTYKSNSV